jgi:hypothetical protein
VLRRCVGRGDEVTSQTVLPSRRVARGGQVTSQTVLRRCVGRGDEVTSQTVLRRCVGRGDEVTSQTVLACRLGGPHRRRVTGRAGLPGGGGAGRAALRGRRQPCQRGA